MTLQLNINTSTSTDLFSISIHSKEEYFEMLNVYAKAKATDGIATLPSGREVDLNSLVGMSVYTTELNFYTAYNETIDNIFNALKGIEKTLLQFLN